MTEEEIPDVSELSDVGQDHIRHRTSRSWVNEAFMMCAGSFALGTFALGTFDVARGVMRQGAPTAPNLVSSLLFCFAMSAVWASYRSLGPESTYPERKRSQLRKLLVLAAIGAALPLMIGVGGLLLRLAELSQQAA